MSEKWIVIMSIAAIVEGFLESLLRRQREPGAWRRFLVGLFAFGSEGDPKSLLVQSVDAATRARAVLALTARTMPLENAEWLVDQPGIDLYALAARAPAAAPRVSEPVDRVPDPPPQRDPFPCRRPPKRPGCTCTSCTGIETETRGGVTIQYPPRHVARSPWKDPAAVETVERTVAATGLTGSAKAKMLHEVMKTPEAAALSDENGITDEDVRALEQIVELMESGHISREEAQRYYDGWPYTRR